MVEYTNKDLQKIANEIRLIALETIERAGSGHIGGSFSLAEIMTVLYFKVMNIDPADPKLLNRDRLVVSKGHASPIVYSTLAKRGYFPMEKLKEFRQIDGHFSGHVEMTHVPGVDMSTGSLGQGLSVAVGMALSSKTYKVNNRIFAITGDGELQEGQNWEAAMAAGSFALDNLCLVVDDNKIQLDGRCCEIMKVEPLDKKFQAFGWHTIKADGHDVDSLLDAFADAEKADKPVAIIANTVKGKGVSIFEDNAKWHGSYPSHDEFHKAYEELRLLLKAM